MSATDLETLRVRYRADWPMYDRLAQRVGQLLREETRRRGIICSVEARAKEVDSLLKKALRKGYGYESIRDKAGARVVVMYYDALAIVEEIVRGRFDVHGYENKRLGMANYELGYLGIHFEVTLRADDLAQGDEDYVGQLCEIQLHTRAQNLWANVSHELLYKTSFLPPGEIQRNVYQLVTLVEIFDDYVRGAQHALLSQPRFKEAKMLSQLERWFYLFSARAFDPELSLQVVKALSELYTPEEIDGYGALLETFVTRHEVKLEGIYRRYAEDERAMLFLYQPESLLVFERLEHDPFRLKQRWAGVFPLDLLDDLARVWGKPVLDEYDA
jgi:ppGpp synthetase/RelA/SpoT-type nucleotidyltranferase